MNKMNLHFITLLIIFSTSSIFAQDYLTKITYQSCECLSSIEDTTDKDQFNLELGLCIIDASMPYKKELKKDHDIDLENINEDGTRLGELIGLKMAGICPEEILKVANGGDDENYDDLSSYISGTVTKIEKEQFVVLSIKDDSGKTTKFYWIYYIDSNVDLETEYTSLVGKKVDLYYYESDLFDARIDEYKPFNIIEELDIIE
jgi:hypothetical protein